MRPLWLRYSRGRSSALLGGSGKRPGRGTSAESWAGQGASGSPERQRWQEQASVESELSRRGGRARGYLPGQHAPPPDSWNCAARLLVMFSHYSALKGCARRAREGPRAAEGGPGAGASRTRRDSPRGRQSAARGCPTGGRGASRGRAFLAAAPPPRAPPPTSHSHFPPHPLPSKKAGFWQRRGRRDGSARAVLGGRPGEAPGTPSLFLGPGGDAPLAPTQATPRSACTVPSIPCQPNGT